MLSRPGTRSGQTQKQALEQFGLVPAQGRKRFGRDTQRRRVTGVEKRLALWGQADGQAASILRVCGGFDKTQTAKPVYDTLDRRPIHRGRPAQLILRHRPCFGQAGKNGELGGGYLRNRGSEDRQMPLRCPAKQIADLIIELVVARFCHALAIRRTGP